MNALPSRTLIVGAGLSGLSCARELVRASRSPAVLERSRGVGGRCATRRVQGQPVDHGAAFLHGSHPDFLSELRSVSGSALIPGWPRRVTGRGTPCQPHAFAPGSLSAAFERGVSAFPKHLARAVDVHLETRVESITLVEGGFRLTTVPPGDWAASDLVLGLPIEQSTRLLAQVDADSEEVRGARALLETIGSLACLTVIAGYSPDQPPPEWDICYPEESRVLQLVSHDSAKRSDRLFLVLVLQARPAWSKTRLDSDAGQWSGEILREAARLLGAWAARPVWTETQRWRYARADAGSQLSAPMLLRLPGGGRLGLAGEVFSPEGGLEGSWLSGRRLARRLIEGA